MNEIIEATWAAFFEKATQRVVGLRIVNMELIQSNFV